MPRIKVADPSRIPCGLLAPGYEDECLCGCTAYEERCEYWVAQSTAGKEVDAAHTCCTVLPPQFL